MFTIRKSANVLYVGGSFDSAGSVRCNGIAAWDGAAWSSLGGGVSLGGSGAASVNAIAFKGDSVFVSGEFSSAGGAPANNVAVWDGKSWHALGNGLSIARQVPKVAALTIAKDGAVIAGGYFNRTGADTLRHIAGWNGSSWLPLEKGLGTALNDMIDKAFDNSVLVLKPRDSIIYAGGDFSNAGTQANVNSIAMWNGATWIPLGRGVKNRIPTPPAATIYAMDLQANGTLYAGGMFDTAGTVGCNYIAKWDGTKWDSLGAGFNSHVTALACTDSIVYAGGKFQSSGAASLSHVAKWQSGKWQALGSGVDSVVNAIETRGDTVYLGGAFMNAGSLVCNRIVGWDGARYFQLGSGVRSAGTVGIADVKTAATSPPGPRQSTIRRTGRNGLYCKRSRAGSTEYYELSGRQIDKKDSRANAPRSGFARGSATARAPDSGTRQ